MTRKILPLLFFLVNLHSSLASLHCNYIYELSRYTCLLTANNPGGWNNYTTISGTHISGFSDNDVLVVNTLTGSNTLNVPAIICEKFRRLETVHLQSAGVKRIDSYSFEMCNNLVMLNSYNNSLAFLSPDAFRRTIRLEVIYFSTSDIEELPKGIFSSLVNLQVFFLRLSKLKVINSDSFGYLPMLKTANLDGNQIDAIDERFINDTAVNYIDLEDNKCLDKIVQDNSESRAEMRYQLRTCFRNFENLPERTTQVPSSTPPGCIGGNIDHRVCELETRNSELVSVIDQLILETKKSLDDLQSQIDVLTSRPCSCAIKE